MKKIISIILALSLMASLSACDSSTNQSQSTTEEFTGNNSLEITDVEATINQNIINWDETIGRTISNLKYSVPQDFIDASYDDNGVIYKYENGMISIFINKQPLKNAEVYSCVSEDGVIIFAVKSDESKKDIEKLKGTIIVDKSNTNKPVSTTTKSKTTTTTTRITTSKRTTTTPKTTVTTTPPNKSIYNPSSVNGWSANGTGDYVAQGLQVTNYACLSITHNGSSNFTIKSYNNDKGGSDLLVNEIGNYSGTVLIAESGNYDIEIHADGNWQINAFKIDNTDGAYFSGHGDAVTSVFLADGYNWKITNNNADSNFVVRIYYPETGERDLLINEIGNYTGIVRSDRKGSVFFEITSNGDWSIGPAN